jgi:hypothetical protein
MAVKRVGELQFPFQLTMFEQARTLDTEMVHGDVMSSGRDADSVREQKLREAASPGSAVTAHNVREKFVARTQGVGSLRDSIASSGVTEPVHVSLGQRWSSRAEPTLDNGHHRVYTAADLDPNMEVPVRWLDHRAPADQPHGEYQIYRKIHNRHPGMAEAAAAARSLYADQKAKDDQALSVKSSGSGATRSGSRP